MRVPGTLLLLALGCRGPALDDTSGGGGLGSCGDPDGSGGDTGDVPDILGLWTATFGTHLYDGNACDVEGLEQDDMYWLNGSMEIGGRVPDRLVATVGDDEDDRFMGVEDPRGGVVFTGSREQAGHTLYVSFGGLLFSLPQLERDEIRGFVTIGVDIDGADQVIDCWVQGDFSARRSGG